MDHIWIIYGLYMDYQQHREDIVVSSSRSGFEEFERFEV